MNLMEALQQWWADPEVVVVPAEETARIIEWLGQQSPDTWHQVATSWNYDYGVRVLRWILNQENCDRGTAAHVFLVEGVGHWLWDMFDDEDEPLDDTHVCNIVLKNWHRYRTGELRQDYEIPDKMMKMAQERGDRGRFAGTPLMEIMLYEGCRDAVSQYNSEDGRIVVDFDFWRQSKGIELT